LQKKRNGEFASAVPKKNIPKTKFDKNDASLIFPWLFLT